MSFDETLTLLKTVSDESRLRLLAILEHRPCSVEELAALLGLREATISHHLSKLKSHELVEVEPEGNTRIYTARAESLQRLTEVLALPRVLNAARKEIDFGSWDDKVLSDFLHRGRLRAIPASRKKRVVVLQWLAAKFPEGKKLAETEVNALLARFHEDFATVRRELIGYGLLARRGSSYWRTKNAALALNPHDEAR